MSGRVNKVLRKVSDLELLQAPNLPYTLPKEYRSLPHLTGMQSLTNSCHLERVCLKHLLLCVYLCRLLVKPYLPEECRG